MSNQRRSTIEITLRMRRSPYHKANSHTHMLLYITHSHEEDFENTAKQSIMLIQIGSGHIANCSQQTACPIHIIIIQITDNATVESVACINLTDASTSTIVNLRDIITNAHILLIQVPLRGVRGVKVESW